MAPSLRPALAFAVAALLATTGCAALRAWIEHEIGPRARELSLDRPSDLMPPEGLRVTSTEERKVALAWDPVLIGDVGGYAVMRSKDRSGPFEMAGHTLSRFGSVFIDAGAAPGSLGDGQTYYYRVHPFDVSGRVSRSHAFVSATTEPAPEVPEGLQTYSDLPRLVVLSWKASSRASVTGYAVFRSPTSSGPWERIGFASGRLQTVYQDPVLGDLRVMYYRLRAVNAHGGESEMTEPVRAMTKPEPLPPISLAVSERELGHVRLRWAPNVEPDVTGYLVLRAVDGAGHDPSEQSVIASVPVPATEALDSAVGCGQRVRYWLRAIDGDGLQSDPSRPLEVVGADIGLVADGAGGKIQLRWDPERTRAWQAARIYERRVLRPDRLLGEVTGSSRFTLPELGAGSHAICVVLTAPGEPAAGVAGRSAGASRPRTAPPCEVTVHVVGSGS